MLDPDTNTFEFFRANLDDHQIRFFLGEHRKTIIYELEVLPMLVAKQAWNDFFVDRSFLVFVDNSSALAALVAGYSSHPIVSKILSKIAASDATSGSLPWYERVPSSANPADAPSRGDVPAALPGWPAPTELFLKTDVDAIIADVRKGVLDDHAGTDADPRLVDLGTAD